MIHMDTPFPFSYKELSNLPVAVTMDMVFIWYLLNFPFTPARFYWSDDIFLAVIFTYGIWTPDFVFVIEDLKFAYLNL